MEMELVNSDSQPTGAAAPQAELLGRIVSVHGSQASVGIPAMSPAGPEEKRITVGKFLGVVVGKSMLVGLITDVSMRPEAGKDNRDAGVAKLDLIGEIRSGDGGVAYFQRGVTSYPGMGDPVAFVGSRELRLIFQSSSARMIEVGHLHQDSDIPAGIEVDEMLSKHFAVLGTTGVGKSSAIALLMQQILQARSDLRVLMLDVHNEYGRCFGERAQVLNPNNIKLPFWLFNFEEIVDVFFGGRPGLEEEVDFLSEVIPLAKSSYAQQIGLTSRLAKPGEAGAVRYTVDVPVPYRIADLLSLLDTRMGKLENRASRMVYHKLMTRIETVCNDPRYAFMFENANVGGDTMAEILATLFRLPPNGKPMTIMQLAGFPSEVVDALVSVTCRMAFDLGLWSDGSAPLLVVCEEAHRYMAADHSVGFAPDPAVDLAHRQGRAQIRRFPRASHAAACGARSDDLVAMQHAVRDAHDQRPRSGIAALGSRRYGRQSAGVFAIARDRRGVRLRRRRHASDPAQVSPVAGANAAAQRYDERRSARLPGAAGQPFTGGCHRALARSRQPAACQSGRRTAGRDRFSEHPAGGSASACGAARPEPLQAPETAARRAGA